MSPCYLNFRKRNSSQKSFWELPINPTFGLVGFVRGAKLFAWYYLIINAINALFYAILMIFINVGYLAIYLFEDTYWKRRNDERSQRMLENAAKFRETSEEIFVPLALRLITSGILLYLSCKVKKAVNKKEVSTLKRDLILITFALVIQRIIVYTLTGKTLDPRVELSDLCTEMIGLLFIYGFIAFEEDSKLVSILTIP